MANNRELSQFASLITVDDSTRTLGINTSIYVSGVSTFVGVGTFNDDLYVQDKLYVGGIEINAGGSSIGTDITTRNLQVTGIATVNSNLIVNGNTLYVDATNNTVGIGTSSSIGTALQKLQVEGGAYFSGNVGIGTTNPGEKLQIDDYNSTQTYSQNVRRTQTDFASGVGVGVNFQDYQTTSGTRYASGSNSVVSTSVAAGVTNSGYIRGGVDAVWRNNNNANSSTDNGTLDDIYGRTIQLGHYNDSVVSPITNNVTGLQITPYAYTGSIGNFTGVNVSSVITAVGATVTNVYGLRSRITTSDGTNTYNLYIDGAAKNYIAGNLGIGTTIPTSKLHVVGDTLVTGVSTIVANSSTEAFRITQTGTGNAFVVEDATNPDATPFVIMADGKVGVGTTGMIQYGSGASDTSTFGILASTGNDSAFVLKGNNGSTTDGSGQTLAVLVGSTGASGSGTNLIHYSHDTTGIGTRRNSIRFTDTQIRFEDNVSGSVDVTINSSGSGELLVGRTSSTGTSNQLLQVEGGAYVSGSVGIGITNPTSKLTVQGDTLVTGVVTATTFIGAFTGIAASATQLVTPRTFEITGDVVASAISFDGTGNVSLAATIQPNSVGLGTDTTGDYVRDITGTSNQITVTSGTGESSTPTLSIPNQFTAPQDVTVTRDLQVNRNLNVNGNITIGGSSATIFTNELKVYDPDIVLGVRTDGSGNDISNDTTANHGGIAVASTEGTPLVSLYDVGVGETNPATYKKIMWFKSGTFTGLNTDAWLINYAVGIGSTQFPLGTRLAAGSVQFTENDLAVVRNINASGITTSSRITLNGANDTATGGGQIYLNGATGNRIDFNTNGAGAPTSTTRSAGTKIVLYPTNLSAQVDYAFGIESQTLWSSVPLSTNQFKWYAGTTNIATLFGTGELVVGTTSKTGTASQPLQVTGGAYVSTRLGVGVTNPGALLDVGNNITNIVAIFGGDTGATTRTDATDKSARIATPHYTNSEEPAALLYALNGSNYNNISIGGGTALMNAATGIEFYTASNTTTVTGTKALTIDNSQRVAIGTDIVGARLHVVSGSNQPAGLFSGTTSADMVRITQLGTGNALVVEDETNPDSTPFVVAASGSVGIAITNPQTALHLGGGGNIRLNRSDNTRYGSIYHDSFGLNIVASSSGDNIYINTDNTNGRILLQNNSSTTLTAQSGTVLIGTGTSTGTASQPLQVSGGAYVSGSVGVGTTNPSSIIEIASYDTTTYSTSANLTNIANIGLSPLFINNKTTGITTAESGIVFAAGGSAAAVHGIYVQRTGSNTGDLIFRRRTSSTTSSESLRVTNSGNVGIGTTNPTAQLQINSSTTNSFYSYRNSGENSAWVVTGDSDVAALRFQNSLMQYRIGIQGSTQLVIRDVTNTGNRVAITSTGEVLVNTTTSTGTASQTLQVTGGAYVSGNTGIGTTNPAVKLEVYDTVAQVGFSTRINTASSNLVITNTAGDAYLNLLNDDNTTGPVANNGAFIGFNGKWSNATPASNRTFGAIGAFKENNTAENQQGYLALYSRPSSGGTLEAIRIDSSQRVGIGTTNPTSTLTVQGNAYITGVTTSTDFDSLSDINLKTNINQIADPLEKVMQIRGVTFNWKEDNRNSAGVIAQEIEKILPELVHGEETKTVNYNGLIGLLIECVKKQQEEIDELKKKVN